MDRRELCLVQNSFVNVFLQKTRVSHCFYERLFQISPDARTLFSGDLTVQGKKLMATLALVVKNLDQFDCLRPAIARLARDHKRYGARKEHYDQAGEALIWALGQVLGDAFDPPTEAAWRRAYGQVAAAMVPVPEDG